MNAPGVSNPLKALGVLSLIVTLHACVPIFSGGEFQNLRISFKFDQSINAGQKRDLQTLIFPENVKVGKRWLQISGRLSAPGGRGLPRQIMVEASLENLQSGRPSQQVKVALKLRDDGTFTGKKKIKKNIAAGEMMGVTLQPIGAEIASGTEITICVDLVQKKTDLDDLPICAVGDSSTEPSTSLSSIQGSIFSPTCAVAGCHSSGSASGGLVLASGQAFSNLVNVPSTGVPSLDRVEPGDPERSYLIKKLRGDADISGSRMPQGGPPLSSNQIDSIIQWIENGASNN